MESILLSIKPEYVQRIFAGTKQYEYRKRLPRENFDKIFVYATYPIMKVVGEVSFIGLLSGSPTAIWEQTKELSGISRAKYREYFRGCDIAYAFHLGEVTKYESPKLLSDFGISSPPQSFVYIDEQHYGNNIKL